MAPVHPQAMSGACWPLSACARQQSSDVSHPKLASHQTGPDEEETGWKYIHGDVFRFPPQKSLFSACVGTGTQILVMAIAIFMMSLVGVFYPYNRGALLSACVVGLLHIHHLCATTGFSIALPWQCCLALPGQCAPSYTILTSITFQIHDLTAPAGVTCLACMLYYCWLLHVSVKLSVHKVSTKYGQS